MKQTIFFFFCWGYLSFFGSAATVDSLSVPYSSSQSFPCIVIKPNSYDTALTKKYPVVYLLHGYSGNASNWIKLVPALKEYADQYNLLIVCPDGGNSWYIDSPVDSAVRYETYIAKTVPNFIDGNYRTITHRKGRAITGLSMGGHGGLFLGFRHSDFFGACGSMSGGVDLTGYKTKFDISKRIGDSIRYAQNWKNYSVINVIEKKPADSLAIIIDCGTEDFFFKDNQSLHKKLLRLQIPHDYTERPGSHNWAYWRNAIKYQLLFFHDYFERTITD